jgi:hypothetical protein
MIHLRSCSSRARQLQEQRMPAATKLEQTAAQEQQQQQQQVVAQRLAWAPRVLH